MFLNVLEKSKIFQQINKKKNGTCMGKGINSKKDTRLSGENFKEALRKKISNNNLMLFWNKCKTVCLSNETEDIRENQIKKC